MAVPGRNKDGHIAYPELSALVCGLCKDGGENVVATGFCADCNEYLCKLCFQNHNLIGRAYKDHKLKRIHEKFSKEFIDTSKCNVNICSKHEGERVQFNCRTHRELGCRSCIVMNHKSCEDIVDVSDEYNSFASNLKSLKQEYMKEAGHAEQNILRVEKIEKDAVDAIKTFHGEIIDISKRLKNASMKVVSQLRNQNDDMVKAISENCVSNLKDIDSLTTVLGTLYEGKRTKELFMKIDEKRSQISQLEADLRTIRRDNNSIINEYVFEPSHQLSRMLQRFDTLGTMVSEKEKTTEQHTEEVSGAKLEDTDRKDSDDVGQTLDDCKVFTNGVRSIGQRLYNNITNKGWILVAIVMLILAIAISVQFPKNIVETTDQNDNKPGKPIQSLSEIVKNRKLEYFRSIDVKPKHDKETPVVSGVGIVNESKLILTDYKNLKVKLINTKIYEITLTLKLDTEPWDVSVIDEHKAAVTLPGTSSIQFITISDKLSFGQTIRTEGGCVGITYWDDKLAVTCLSTTGHTDKWSLDILDMNGKIFNRIRPEHNGQLLFDYPRHVTVSDADQEFYVSDEGHKAVYRLSVQGQVKAMYIHPDIQWPRGLTVGPGGAVYLCDKLSASVYQLSCRSCCFQKVLGDEDEVESPISLSYDGDNLYVGTAMGKVQVFHRK